MRRSSIICIAALFAAAASTPALARDVQTQSRVVYFGDLNLDSSHGAHRLVRRIERASAEVCDDNSGERRLAERADITACRADAEENAVDDLDHPVVSAEYYGPSHGTVIIQEDVDNDQKYGPYADGSY